MTTPSAPMLLRPRSWPFAASAPIVALALVAVAWLGGVRVHANGALGGQGRQGGQAGQGGQAAPATQGTTVAVRAQARPNPTPAWGKGILPLTPESYYNAIECGKQGVADPPCVFWDTDICKNDDFTLAWYSPYKQVAYEVWVAVSRKQPAPQPNYQAALKANVTIGVTQVKGAKNALKEVVVKRGGKPALVLDRSLSGGGGRYSFAPATFAATADVVIDLIGSARTISCTIPQAALRQMR